MDDLEGLLHQLQSFVNEPVKAESVIKRISQLFGKVPEGGCTDLLLFLIFSENGIIEYIKRVFNSEENRNNVLSAFQLLEFLLVNFESYCIPYVTMVQHMCLGIVQSNTSAKLKENSMKLLKSAFAPSFIVVLDISKIIQTVNHLKESLPPSVKSQLFSLMGIIFEKVPEISQSEKDQFLGFFLSEIDKIRKSTSMMEGCFNAIYGYLVNFLPTKKQISQIYSLLKENSLLKEDQTRRVTERSALRIIVRHYRVFATYIYDDIQFWREALGLWVNKKKEDRRLGFAALVAVYRAVAHVFETSNREIATEKLNKTVEDMLNGLESTFKIASMVGVVELVSTGFIRDDLANRVMQLITKRVGSTTNRLMYLSINLECVSKYMTRSMTVKPELLLLAERIAVALIDNYPKIDSDFQHSSLEALGKSFHHLRQCGDQVLDEYVKEVVYQGLVRNCSHHILTDVELLKDIAGMNLVSYESFLPLWLYLLNASSTDWAPDDIVISEKIFDEYISSFLRINKKLDLRIEMTNPQATDPEEAGEAIRPNDFKIFINNVSLFVDVTEDMKNPELMSKWLPWIFTETVNSSYKSPLISGFYKVITSCLKIADKITYFWDPVTDPLVQPDSESDQWFRHLQKFLQDVSVRVGRYKGELQISCFQIFLSAPMKLIEPFLRDLVPIFKVILRVGSGHLPLLRECLSTLERWYTCLGRFDSASKESMEYLLRSILPYFNVFLQSKERKNGLTDTAEEKWKPLKIRGQVQKVHSGSESELLNIQRKFLLFLGKLDQEICNELIQSVDEDDGNEEVEEFGKKLTYDVPLSDMKLRIHIDELLPRVMELSLLSTDRQTRINACEFLHSVVLLTFGNMKQMNGELKGLFRKLITACLILGCDSDLIVFQMYDPLLMQIVHYFADRERESSQTFINCLMEAASHPFNSTLRDFAAKLIREFTSWSIKSQDPGETPKNLKTILRSMYSYSVHPDHNKRCGAAVVFNNICTVIQEETDVLNTHWFLLYFHFMECLSMSTVYDDTTHVISAVEFIKRSITEKSFTPRVKLPSGFKDNSTSSLMQYIFSRCTHSNTSIRTLSMGLCESIGRCGSSVKEFVRLHGASAYMKPEFLKENATVEEYVNWLEYNATLFSYYNWLLIQEGVTENDLLKADVDKLLGIFLRNPTPSYPWFEIHTKRIVAVIQMLQFFTSCVKLGIVWHKESAARVIKTCLFTPSELKFELCDVGHRETLNAIFAELIPRFAVGLSSAEIDCLLDMDLDFARLNSYLHPDRSLYEMAERVNGLKMMHRLGLWHLGFHRLVSGDVILKSVFESVFHVRPRGTFSMFIRPGDKIFLEDLLGFGKDIEMSLDVLFIILTNREEIYDVKTSKKMTKGEFFMNLFKEFVYDFMISKSERSITGIFQNFSTNSVEIILKLLKHADRVGCNREKFISDLSKRWSHLEKLTSTTTVLLSVVKGMCMLDPNVLQKERHISEWVYSIMTTVSSLEEVEAVCGLFPYLSALYEDSNGRLMSCLDTFYKNQNFFSSEQSLACPKVITCYEGFLRGFIRTKSLPLLHEIIKLLTKYDTLIKEHEIDTLSIACQVDVPEDHVIAILSFLYGKVFSSVEAPSVYQRFLEKFLQNCERDSVWKFFLENLKNTVRVLQDGNVPLKFATLEIVQACVAGVAQEKWEKLTDDMKGVFRSLVMICMKREVSCEEPELQRKYVCECFNTLCTIIAARTNDPLQYKCLIFRDDFSILPHLINRDKVWSLRMDFDELPERRKVLTSLRKSITKERQMKLGKSINSVRYLEEETLFDSSLKEDVTKFDFTSAFVGPADGRERTGGLVSHVELEMDDLNKHECMVTIIEIIEHLVDAGITPEDVTVPFWLSSLLRRLSSLHSSENEKIFLLKLMCNIDTYIKPYASSVIPEILITLIDVFQEKPINYLVIDVLTMILNWKADLSTLSMQLRGTVSHLAFYIVKKSGSYRKDIVKSNMEVVKLIIEAFRDIINVEFLSEKAFEGLLKQEGMSDSSMYANLHFCGVLLANSIPPWLDNKEEEFLRALLNHCRSTTKLGTLAAQVCGMTLSYLENADCADKLIEIVRDKIQPGVTINGWSDLSPVYSIHKFFPRISSSFARSIRTCSWTVKGPFKVKCLEMLLSYVRRLQRVENDAFGSLLHSFLEDMVSADDVEVLDLSMQIIEVVLGLTVERMERVVEKALALGECRTAGVRRSVYNVAIMVYEGWEDRFSRSLTEDIRKQCKVLLLRGMNDSDCDSREKCLQFWYRRTRGSSSTDQFSRILRDVYAGETEDGFLNIAATLMMRSCAESPDYKTFIFEHPLVQNSTFRTRNILKTIQHSTIAPMFAQTLTGQLSQPGLLQSLSSAPSLLQTLFLQGTIQQDGVESGVTVEEETSKRGRRFVRDPQKVQLYFAKKQKMKKAELEEREREKKNGLKIEVLREYTDGDYPNIQITHPDLLKPLEVLTMRDPQIGRYFLTSVYDGFIERVEVKPFLETIRDLVQQVMNESTESDPSFIAFLFHLLLRCDGCVEADSEWVATLSKSSGCFSLGKLLIEAMITRAEWDEHDRDRRSGLIPVDKQWMNLAEICRDLKEFEVLRGIFLEKLHVVGEAADAIRSESVSHWLKAAELYEPVLKSSLYSFSNFYEDAYSNCLARLSDWTKLSDHIRENYNFEDLWSELGLSERILPWFMKSEAMRSLLTDGGKSLTELVKKVQESPDKDIDLKRFFNEELAIAYFSQGTFEWLKYHLYQIYKNFLASWSHWNKWSNTLRKTKLMELQLPWELESCSSVLTSTDGMTTDLLDQWSRNHPRDADDLMTWDMKLTCRNHFLSMLKMYHPEVDRTEVVKSSILADFGIVKAGIAQRNVQLSQKYMQRIEGKLKECTDRKLGFMHDYYMNSLEMLREEMYCNDRKARCVKYVTAALRLKEITVERDAFSFESNIALSRIMDLLQADMEQVSRETIQEVATRLGMTFDGVSEGIKAKKLEYLEKALEAAGSDVHLQSKTFMEVVKHYRTHVGYTIEMAKCLLRAMSCGNPEARQLFCCLLNETEFATDWVTNSDLKSISRVIPTWMYLTWTNQILANLNSDMFPFLKEILLLLAEEYPNSIRYSFRLSKETYTYDHGRYGKECRLFACQLERKLLSDHTHMDLLTALSYVTPPDLVFKYDMDILLAELSQAHPKWDRMVEVIRDLHKRMYGEEYRSFRGTIFDCLSSLRSELEGLSILEREKSLWLEKIVGLVKALPKISTENVSLKSYSPWLYNSVNRNATFELPCQQKGERPNRSVTIWSFKSNVLVMNSKCRPIRITVLGNDAREHKYLIKFGEDLRQDQRIQQVFSHMNDILRGNQHTSGLSIDTYNVLPLKCNLGMIEWVSNTSSLHDMLTKGDEKVRQIMERVQQEHLEFLSRGDSITKAVAAHLNGYMRVSRTEAIARFNERVHSFEWDLLRKAFWRMSLYPEQFVFLRNNFAVSQAVIYIAHWLIGIGDRHLDNTLVSYKTGRALGIDFGCAFGFATEFLTPPELLPFRLTPQIVNLMKPMGETVLIKETMVQSLRALRRERDILIAALEVFVSEPTLDWLERTKRDQKSRKDDRVHIWNPRQKIAVVTEKLQGVNPVTVFKNDLISGHSNTQYLEKYLEVLNGGGSRSQLRTFTEEEQVNCLIDLATDYHILSKTYVGWNPWL